MGHTWTRVAALCFYSGSLLITAWFGCGAPETMRTRDAMPCTPIDAQFLALNAAATLVTLLPRLPLVCQTNRCNRPKDIARGDARLARDGTGSMPGRRW